MNYILLMVLLSASNFALVADAPADPGTRAKPVAPFLEDHTVAVAHVDASRLDVEKLADRLTELANVNRATLAAPAKLLSERLKAFRKAGGRDAYIVFSLADLPESFYVVVPLHDDSDATALAGQLQVLGATEQVHGALIAGRANTIQRVRTIKPVPQPDVEKALT